MVLKKYDQALKETNADTVYVAVPNSLHYSFAKKALLAGKNVICEKPFTVKYDEFKELKQIAKEKQLILVEAITNQFRNTLIATMLLNKVKFYRSSIPKRVVVP